MLLQRRLDEMGAQLLHAERLASLGTMASAVGHELSNILGAFQTTVRLVREQASEGRAAEEEQLKVLDWVGEHLASHSAQLLRTGRPARGGEPVADLRRAATEVLAMLWSAGVTRRVQVDLVAPNEPLPVPLDRVRLEQVLINLMNNAVDAVEQSGAASPRISVRLSHGSRPRVALCEIEDNGCGIAESHLPQMFKAYFTTKAPEQGTGLGLFVVKRIVDSSGGAVGVRRAEGRGSVFWVRLPLAPEPTGYDG